LAAATTAKLGARVMPMQHMAITAEAPATRNRFRRVASMKAPIGVCASRPEMPEIDMTTPMLAASQCWVVSR
jgi:hypothetical protein